MEEDRKEMKNLMRGANDVIVNAGQNCVYSLKGVTGAACETRAAPGLMDVPAEESCC